MYDPISLDFEAGWGQLRNRSGGAFFVSDFIVIFLSPTKFFFVREFPSRLEIKIINYSFGGGGIFEKSSRPCCMPLLRYRIPKRENFEKQDPLFP